MERAFAAHGCGRSTDLPSSRHSGFSLVELSIVLVILGLLTGGILTGQNLIRAAELRSVVTQISQFQTAALTFRSQYFSIPGDIKNATDFWGAMTNCGVASPSGTGTQTCNGDGDGIIESASAGGRTGERFGFWQHLANAGLIEGSYTGIAGDLDGRQAVVGENVPRAKLNNAGWGTGTYDNSDDGDSGNFSINYGSFLVVGRESTTAPNGDIFTPEETWNIDAKIDDGFPARGRITPFGFADCTTATNNDDHDATYNFINSGIECQIFVRNIF